MCFDIESKLIFNGENKFSHKPKYLAAKVICDTCWDPVLKDKKENYCNICKIGALEYKEKCVTQFNDYVLDTLSCIAEDNGGHVDVFAHNLSGYDGQFIFKDLLDQGFLNIEPVLKGIV